MDYVLRTFGLSKAYKKKNVLENVNINVRKGDIYGFIGRNGAGKTTLIKLVSGIAAPTGGSIELFLIMFRIDEDKAGYFSESVVEVMTVSSLTAATSPPPTLTPFAAASAFAAHKDIAAEAALSAIISFTVKKFGSFLGFEEYTLRNILYTASIRKPETSFIRELLSVFWTREKSTFTEFTISFLLNEAIIPPAP